VNDDLGSYQSKGLRPSSRSSPPSRRTDTRRLFQVEVVKQIIPLPCVAATGNQAVSRPARKSSRSRLQ
jgi:hypothetical protein